MLTCTGTTGTHRAPCVALADGPDGLCPVHRALGRVARDGAAVQEAARRWRTDGEAAARDYLRACGYAWDTWRGVVADATNKLAAAAARARRGRP